MARKQKNGFDEKGLNKGQLRKLSALRKSLGEDIANRAFAQWIANQHSPTDGDDRNARQIVETLHPLIASGKLRIPRGGYILRRGRGRIIIERPE